MALPVIGIGALVAAISSMLVKWAFELAVALGVSFVSYQFTSAAFEKLMGHIQSNYFQVDQVVLDIFALAGIPEAFNIIFGAFNFCVGLFTTGKALKFFHGVKK